MTIDGRTKERNRSDITIAFSALRNEIVLRWYRTRWLRFVGAVIAGLYGSLAVGFFIIGALATWVWPDPGAGWMWGLGVGCVLATAFGWWIHTSEG